jgi:hypothetical protein
MVIDTVTDHNTCADVVDVLPTRYSMADMFRCRTPQNFRNAEHPKRLIVCPITVRSPFTSPLAQDRRYGSAYCPNEHTNVIICQSMHAY